MHKRQFLRRGSAVGLAAVLGLATLGGCASINQLTVDVSSFGAWPAGRAPASYAFERLPSQQSQPERQQQLEDAAKAALAAAGFTPAATGTPPDVLVQLGARISRTERSVWDDPLWWHGSFGLWGGSRRPWVGPYWQLSTRLDHPRYEREVAVMLRDRASGAPLYEARGSSEGYFGGGGAALRPLFDAALKDFPAAGPNPRQVTVPLG